MTHPFRDSGEAAWARVAILEAENAALRERAERAEAAASEAQSLERLAEGCELLRRELSRLAASLCADEATRAPRRTRLAWARELRAARKQLDSLAQGIGAVRAR
jgi:transcriptional regulator GlxA family with amidase domain